MYPTEKCVVVSGQHAQRRLTGFLKDKAVSAGAKGPLENIEAIVEQGLVVVGASQTDKTVRTSVTVGTHKTNVTSKTHSRSMSARS